MQKSGTLVYCATVAVVDELAPDRVRFAYVSDFKQRAWRAMNEEPGMTQLKKHQQSDRFFSESAMHAFALDSAPGVSPDL